MNIKFIITLLVLIVISGFFPTDNSVGQLENGNSSVRTSDSDNSHSSATEISSTGSFTGSVNASDDLFDFYKVYLNADTSTGDLFWINFTITDPTGIGLFIVQNPEKYYISDGLCYKGINNFVNRSICACTTGFYYIMIWGPSSEANYKFEVGWSSTARSIDSDNLNATANIATDRGVYNGNLDPVYDYLDLYNISITSGTTTTEGLIVELYNYVDKTLFIYNPNGTLRQSEDILSSSNPDEKEMIKIAADQTGTYRIVVSSSNDLIGPGAKPCNYTLKTNIVPGIPPDNDYNSHHATLVFDGTEINTSFDSEFDFHDFFMIDLNKDDNLTVSILYKDGIGDVNIEILDEEGWSMNDYSYSDYTKGHWTWGVATETRRHYIDVYTLDFMGNYTILFSKSGDNLWLRDQPVKLTPKDLDFKMREDAVDMSHVNLNEIFYDSDSALIFDSPSHPISGGGKGKNVDIDILYNGTVKFIPTKDFNGFEVVNFSAEDIKSNVLYWEVNVTVVNVNDAPVILSIGPQTWKEDIPVNLSLVISDIDSDELNITDNTDLFDVDTKTKRIEFTPKNEDVGEHNIWINVSDGDLLDGLFLTVTILNSNDDPVIQKVGGKDAVRGYFVDLEATEDSVSSYDVEVIDIDHDIGASDTMVFSTNITDTAFSIDKNTGKITFLPIQKHVGNFYAEISVSDEKGGVCHQNLSIKVYNVNDPPEAPKIYLKNKEGLTVNLSTDEIKDEDSDTVTLEWNFGDGTKTETGTEVKHTYSIPGRYNITLTASDGNGGVSTSNMSIDVDRIPEIIIDDNITDDDKNDTKINGTDDDTNDIPTGDDDDTTDDGKSGSSQEDKKSLTENWWFYPVVGGVIILVIVLTILISVFMMIKKKKQEEEQYTFELGSSPGGIPEGEKRSDDEGALHPPPPPPSSFEDLELQYADEEEVPVAPPQDFEDGYNRTAYEQQPPPSPEPDSGQTTAPENPPQEQDNNYTEQLSPEELPQQFQPQQPPHYDQAVPPPPTQQPRPPGPSSYSDQQQYPREIYFSNEQMCSNCGQVKTYFEQYNRYYCNYCHMYD